MSEAKRYEINSYYFYSENEVDAAIAYGNYLINNNCWVSGSMRVTVNHISYYGMILQTYIITLEMRQRQAQDAELASCTPQL